jgi:hypothetical protein
VAILPGHPYAEPVRRGYPFLRAAGAELRAEGVAFHDLTQVFAGVGEPLYVDDCCHVATEGTAILADAVAQAILDDLARRDREPAAAQGRISTATPTASRGARKSRSASETATQP